MVPIIDYKLLKPLTAEIPVVSSTWSRSDRWSAVKVRWGIGRNNSAVKPGLYKIGNPGSQSDVLVTSNYKLTFDTLRKNLGPMSAWILVLDTKGVNVWCAAGKGTFGTDNLVKSITNSSLKDIVKHRTVIVPQLGAVGVAAHKVKEKTGFRVVFGPVRAADIRAFVEAGYKASPEMRKISFPMKERAKLIPVDLLYSKYKLLAVLFALFLFSGLDRQGFLFSKMAETSLYPLLSLIAAYLSGIVIAPLLLPFIPFRAFALKGAFWGVASSFFVGLLFDVPLSEKISMGLMGTTVASFMTMNFTGSSTFTSLSGVKREMKLALPLQIIFAAAGFLLFIISKLA